MTNSARDAEQPVVAGWRFRLGVALFALSLLGPPVLIPLVAALGLPVAITSAISGAILVGGEVLLVAAAAVMGKSGYAYIKKRAFGFLKQHGPPREVSRARYRIGLVAFSIPILFGWLSPYADTLIPGYEGNETTFAVVGEAMLLVSLFILGGDFWDKLRELFIHHAKVEFGREAIPN